MRYRPPDPAPRDRARQLRREQTSAEARLWRELRRGNLGSRFRRQEPIGPYIVDFVCLATRLVVEVDGATHEDPEPDARRDALLERLGFRVLRFWNGDVYHHLEGVLDRIAAELERPSP
ncbi:MAG: endonuclease domain-containing protein [Acidimicrobiia bacterium]